MLTGILCSGSMWLCELILGFHCLLSSFFSFFFLLEFYVSTCLVTGSPGGEWRMERVELWVAWNGLCLVAEKAREKKGEIKKRLRG